MSSYLIQHALLFHGLLAAKAAPAKSSSSTAPFLIIVAIFAVIYIFLFRGKNSKRKKAVQESQNVGIGDEVMLTSGIIGRITELEGDRACIEIAPDIEIEIVRRAISQRLTPADAPDPDLEPDPGAESFVDSTGLPVLPPYGDQVAEADDEGDEADDEGDEPDADDDEPEANDDEADDEEDAGDDLDERRQGHNGEEGAVAEENN